MENFKTNFIRTQNIKPVQKKHVLTYNEDNKCYYIVYLEDSLWYHMETGNEVRFDVTHWSYLAENF